MLVRRNLAWVRLASPSMFMVPMKLVLIVLMGLYLQTAAHNAQLLLCPDRRVSEADPRDSVMHACVCEDCCICNTHAKMSRMHFCREPQGLRAVLCTSIYLLKRELE